MHLVGNDVVGWIFHGKYRHALDKRRNVPGKYLLPGHSSKNRNGWHGTIGGVGHMVHDIFQVALQSIQWTHEWLHPIQLRHERQDCLWVGDDTDNELGMEGGLSFGTDGLSI